VPPASNRPNEPKQPPTPGPGRRPSQPSAASASAETAPPSGTPGPAASPPHTSAAEEPRGITMTIPADRIFSAAAGIVTTPIAVARQVLPAKGGMPLYAGLGALAVVGIIDWPVAAAAGAGYALARYWTRQEPQMGPRAADTP